MLSRKSWLRVALIFAFALLILAIVWQTLRIAANPLRQNDVTVRNSLLQLTPLGTSRGDVETILKARGWDVPAVNAREPDPPQLVGKLGGYQPLEHFPWPVLVYAFWDFDSDGRLQEVRIERMIDSP